MGTHILVNGHPTWVDVRSEYEERSPGGADLAPIAFDKFLTMARAEPTLTVDDLARIDAADARARRRRRGDHSCSHLRAVRGAASGSARHRPGGESCLPGRARRAHQRADPFLPHAPGATGHLLSRSTSTAGGSLTEAPSGGVGAPDALGGVTAVPLICGRVRQRSQPTATSSAAQIAAMVTASSSAIRSPMRSTSTIEMLSRLTTHGFGSP
jgi:hypothetical protein